MKRNPFYYIFITLVLLTSCKEDKVIPIEEYLILQTKNVTVPSEGGEFQIRFKTIGKVTYTIDQNSDWILPEEMLKGNSSSPYYTDELKFGVQSSDSLGDRKGYIYLHCEQDTDTVTVSQKMREYISLETDEIEVSQNGEIFTVNIYSNSNFSFSIDNESPWIKSITDAENPEHSDNHLHQLQFEADPGDIEKSRTGHIHFIIGNFTETLTVYQPQREDLTLSQDKLETDAFGGTFTIKLGHNVGYSVSIPEEVDWVNIPAAQTAEYITEEVTIAVSRNNDTQPRECIITFTGTEADLSAQLHITQGGMSQYFAEFMNINTPGWYRYTPGEEFVIEYEKYISQYAVTLYDGTTGFRIVSGENFFVMSGIDNDPIVGNIYNIQAIQNYFTSFSRNSDDNYVIEKIAPEEGLIWLFDHKNGQGMIVKNK